MSFERKYRLEIQQMMFGEVPDPLPETTALVEDIVRGQVIEMITQATQHAIKRGSRSISVEDLIFLIRHDKPKVNRLKTYLSWKDVRKNAKEQDGVESPEIIDGSDEYVHYSECRQASFTYRKSKRFREWSGMNQLMDCRPNDDIIDILGFLTFEIVATITEESLRVKAQMDSLEESDIFKEKGEKYLFDNPEESRTPLQVKHIEEGFRRLQEPQPKHIVMRGFDGGLVKSHVDDFKIKNEKKNKKSEILIESVISPNSALNKISNQKLIFNFLADFNFEKTDSYSIQDRKLYTSPFIKNIIDKKNKNLWGEVSRDLNGKLIGEEDNLFLKKKNIYIQNSTQNLEFSKIIESNINSNIFFDCHQYNMKKKYIARSFESNFIVINSSGSEEEPLSNDSVNLDKPINSSLLENDYNIDKNEFQELHTENLCLKGDLKSRKQGLFNKNSLESTNITLNDILSTEGHTQDKFLSGIAKSDINDNTLNECKLKRKKKNYVFKRKKLFKIIKTKKKINFKETIIPNFQKYTFVELQSEISKYGFKTMRSKKAIIELLTKCWKMSNSLKQKQLIENDKESNEFDSFQILNNILSEQSISDALQNCTLLMYFGNGLQCIFLTITKILKSSSGEIYWSKILRYEPIVLETFAKWLFEQNIVVTLDILKQYCNIHGICSVHFKTNRGSAKKYL
ncbi:hypothetical protein PCK1_000320 [Pneumocystis canis]|nr:hypothetical protein PCK1_000320 [Pneumocystis canis]